MDTIVWVYAVRHAQSAHNQYLLIYVVQTTESYHLDISTAKYSDHKQQQQIQ